MSKSTKIIIAAVCALVAAVAILAVLNYRDIAARRELAAGGTFLLTHAGQTRIVSIDDLLAVGTQAVSASPRGMTRNFTGVPLAGIFAHFGIDYSGAGAVIFTSLDGFVTAISLSEALDTRNAFIVFKENGEPLGAMQEGGQGPFMLVLTRDPFPNRWARYLMEVALQ